MTENVTFAKSAPINKDEKVKKCVLSSSCQQNEISENKRSSFAPDSWYRKWSCAWNCSERPKSGCKTTDVSRVSVRQILQYILEVLSPQKSQILQRYRDFKKGTQKAKVTDKRTEDPASFSLCPKCLCSWNVYLFHRSVRTLQNCGFFSDFLVQYF